MRAWVLSRVRIMVSRPRQLSTASTAIKAKPNKSSTKVKPDCLKEALRGFAANAHAAGLLAHAGGCGFEGGLCILKTPKHRGDAQHRGLRVHHLRIHAPE